MKSFGPLHLVLFKDFNERCVDHHCFLDKLSHKFVHFLSIDFVFYVVSNRVFLPMLGDAQLHVVGTGGKLLEGLQFDALNKVVQSPIHALYTYLDQGYVWKHVLALEAQ